MNGGYILLGDFTGRFKTSQAVSLGTDDAFPKDESHHVRVFSGKMWNTKFYADHQPENFRKQESFVLHNVPNIEIQGASRGGFSDTRLYSFVQLIIIEPKVSNIHEINGVTYGDLNGQAYGLTETNPQIDRIDPDPFNRPGKPGGGGGFGGGGFNTGTDFGGYLDELQTGCGSLLTGCLANIWRILGIFFLLLLIFWLFKSCDDLQKDRTCEKRDNLAYQIEKEKKVLDSLKKVLNSNFPSVMAKISTVYFFKNSDEIHPYSLSVTNDGDKVGNLHQLLSALKIFKEKKFNIFGYFSQTEKGIDPNIDLKRAQRIKEYFVSQGIDEKRLFVVRKGMLSKEISNSTSLYSNYTIKEYNPDMRVVVQEKK